MSIPGRAGFTAAAGHTLSTPLDDGWIQTELTRDGETGMTMLLAFLQVHGR
ncbi:MAG: hypothetical protein WCI02_13370 [Planctomycetota bacterium]